MTRLPELEGVEHPPVVLADLLGVEPGSDVAGLVASPENLLEHIRSLACGAMTDELTDRFNIGGEEYRVSKGDEHFSSTPGKLDGVIRENTPQFFGFRLYQKVPDRKDDYSPILLVQNGGVRAPLLEINPNTGHITNGDSISFVESVDDLDDYLAIVGSIVVDSRKKAQSEAEWKQAHRRSIRHKLYAVAAAATILFVGVKEGPSAYDALQQWNQDRIEADARQAAEERAQEDQAREAREAIVRDFDSTHNIQDAPAFAVDSAGIAVASDQFDGESVPDFDDPDISSSLARDASHPREVELDTGDDVCMTVEKVPIRAGDTVVAVHNGGTRSAYTVFASAGRNVLEICDQGEVGSGSDLSGADAEQIVFQVLRPTPDGDNNRPR